MLRIGTRSSDLARRQAEFVRDALAARGIAAELVFISSKGDEAVDIPFRALEGIGFFSAEIETALLAGRVDIAVHSLKDLPTQEPPGLTIAAIPPREDTRDVLLVHPSAWAEGGGPAGLPLRPGARVGTSSERRAALVRAAMPSVAIVPLRGNVPTRVEKVRAGACEATFLAAAGLRRLGMNPENLPGVRTRLLDTRDYPPAPGQGAIAVQVREEDRSTREAVGALNHPPTMHCVRAERALLALLGGGCSLPLGCLAVMSPASPGSPGGAMHMHAALAREGGIRRGDATGGDPHELARELMTQLGGPVR